MQYLAVFLILVAIGLSLVAVAVSEIHQELQDEFNQEKNSGKS